MQVCWYIYSILWEIVRNVFGPWAHFAPFGIHSARCVRMNTHNRLVMCKICWFREWRWKEEEKKTMRRNDWKNECIHLAFFVNEWPGWVNSVDKQTQGNTTPATVRKKESISLFACGTCNHRWCDGGTIGVLTQHSFTDLIKYDFKFNLLNKRSGPHTGMGWMARIAHTKNRRINRENSQLFSTPKSFRLRMGLPFWSPFSNCYSMDSAGSMERSVCDFRSHRPH